MEGWRDGCIPKRGGGHEIASRDSVGCWRENGVRRGKHEPTGSVTNEVGGGSASGVGNDGVSAKAGEGSAQLGVTTCVATKLCSRCNGRGRTTQVCPMSKDEVVQPMTGDIGAGVVDVGEDSTL